MARLHALLSQFRDGAYLLEHAQVIGVAPVLHKLSVLIAPYMGLCPCYLSAGRSDAQVLASVCTAMTGREVSKAMPEADKDYLTELKRTAERLGRASEWGLEALHANTRILAEEPDNFAALVRRGRCHKEQDDFPAARENYARALRIKPGTKHVEDALDEIERGWAGAEERA